MKIFIKLENLSIANIYDSWKTSASNSVAVNVKIIPVQWFGNLFGSRGFYINELARM